MSKRVAIVENNQLKTKQHLSSNEERRTSNPHKTHTHKEKNQKDHIIRIPNKSSPRRTWNFEPNEEIYEDTKKKP